MSTIRLALLPCLVVLATPVPATAGTFDGDAPPDVVAERRAELDAARAKWAAAGIEDYSFRLRRICFCFVDYLGPVRIHVRDGKPHGGGKEFRDVNRVEKLFRVLRDHLDAHGYLARYGGRLGIPRDIDLDPAANVADEEVGYRLDRFREDG